MPINPDRKPNKCDLTTAHVMVQHARKLHGNVELAWHEFVGLRQEAAEANPEGIVPSLDPRTWTTSACTDFLRIIYDKTAPEDGIPSEHPRDGCRAALAHAVAYLTARDGRGAGRPDNVKAQWISHIGSQGSALGNAPARRSVQQLTSFLA